MSDTVKSIGACPELYNSGQEDMEIKSLELTIPLLHRHGNQGILDGASKGSLESEFGTSNDDEVVKQILEKGSIVETGVSGQHIRDNMHDISDDTS